MFVNTKQKVNTLFSTQTLLLGIYSVPLSIAALRRNRKQNENLLCINILLLAFYTNTHNKI